MADISPNIIQQRMLEDLKKRVSQSGQFLTAGNLAEFFNLNPIDLQSQLHEWVTRGEIFSVRDESAGELFPVFAFDRNHGICPLDAIAKVLFIFGGRLSGLAIASWFIGLNSYLDDQCPKDLVAKDPDWVIEAAQDEIDEVAHG